MRGYQSHYSQVDPTLYDLEGRRRKAQTVVAVLREVLAAQLPRARVLDVGASTGHIDAVIVEHVASLVGIDIDQVALENARRQYPASRAKFLVADAMNLPFESASFDVVLCMHVYEHVPDSQCLFDEIFRLLRPGGVCYFSAANRLIPIEPHYGLPFLSWLTPRLANTYLRLLGRSEQYYERLLTYAGLKTLTRLFTRHDFTRRVIAEPEYFGTEYMFAQRSLKQSLALKVVDWAYALSPGFIWVLEKPPDSSRL